MSTSFDLSSVLATAQEVSKTGSSKSDEGASGYRFLYPRLGTLKVKLLYNPKSKMLGRVTKKHVVENSKAICLSMYGHDCPICKVLKDIKNAVGQDMWKYNARVKAVIFAQYVGATNYTWDKDNPEPKPGEVVLLMAPWTVYQDINRLLASCGSHAEQLIATNVGKVVNISRWQENGMTKYQCAVDAFASDFQSTGSEEEFVKMLNDLPSLDDLNAPSAISEEIIKKTNEVAENLSRELLKPVNSAPVQASTAFQASPQPVAPAAPASIPSIKDFPCMGNYNPNDTKCLACAKGVSCKLFGSDSVPF